MMMMIIIQILIDIFRVSVSHDNRYLTFDDDNNKKKQNK